MPSIWRLQPPIACRFSISIVIVVFAATKKQKLGKHVSIYKPYNNSFVRVGTVNTVIAKRVKQLLFLNNIQ